MPTPTSQVQEAVLTVLELLFHGICGDYQRAGIVHKRSESLNIANMFPVWISFSVLLKVYTIVGTSKFLILCMRFL